jgi:hypothetical protein
VCNTEENFCSCRHLRQRLDGTRKKLDKNTSLARAARFLLHNPQPTKELFASKGNDALDTVFGYFPLLFRCTGAFCYIASTETSLRRTVVEAMVGKRLRPDEGEFLMQQDREGWRPRCGQKTFCMTSPISN